MRVRKGSAAALRDDVNRLKVLLEMTEDTVRRLEPLRLQNRSAAVVLEAERTELLARVQKIEATLELLGRTRSHGTSPDW